ncbi:MAG: chemotaxis protein CheX [Chloroflexota bacterium]|jgi:chemotaxis protein CheX
MDVRFLNPFVEAAVEVLKAEIGVNVERKQLSLQQSAMTTDDVTVLIHLVGQVQGVVLYGMNTRAGIQFVAQILGQEFNEFDSLAQSGVAELGNVISGRATIKFSQAGYSSNISPPTLITGKGVQISTLDFPRIVVPLETNLGMLTVHLALRENLNGKSEEFVALTPVARGS